MIPRFDWFRLPEVVEMCLRIRGVTSLKDIADNTGYKYQCVRTVFRKQNGEFVGLTGHVLTTIIMFYGITFEEIERVWAVMNPESF